VTDGPRRRGRPPGSKNKTAQPAPVLDSTELAPLMESPGVTVMLRFKTAMSTKSEEQEASWPTGWRIPQAGDAVHLRNDYGGFVQYVDFDLGHGRIVIHLK
jgi:hypothetical protein